MIEAPYEQTAISRADIAVYSEDGQLQLIVEVKARTRATAEWAAQLRRNLAVHLALPIAPYFLLALPDHFYLWRDLSDPLSVTLAEYDIDPAPLLAPYISDVLRLSGTLSDGGLEMAVTAWLRTVITSHVEQELGISSQKWLFDSGLYFAIKDGAVSLRALQ